MNYNDIVDIYKDPIVVTDDGYSCNVCGRTYKRSNSLEKHLSRMDCFNVVDMFRNTTTEYTIREIVNAIYVNVLNRNPPRSFKNLRKKRIYSQVAKVMIYNIRNNINDIENYILWGIKEMSHKGITQVFNFLLKERVSFIDFYNFRRSVISESEQQRFFDMNEQQILDSTSFTIRQVEKGLLTFEFLSSKIDIEEFFSNLTDVQRIKVKDLVQNIK